MVFHPFYFQFLFVILSRHVPLIGVEGEHLDILFRSPIVDRPASRKPRLLRWDQGTLSDIDIFLAGKPRSSKQGASPETLTNLHSITGTIGIA
ncbi:MAG: hypothetical protein A2V65_02020 [Deltaproteobacteria bacterium RBG_13_49_15]|nr:MAG: hypothetical protein A2V65_02020 [Deltaproteobacteria bacterium RBG_13_49_15]